MKRKEKPSSVEIPPVRLFLEDLEEIEEVYKKYCKELKIETEDFEFDSVEELKNIGKDKLNSLSFNSHDPYISVNFSPSNARIYSSEPDPKSVGIVAILKNILDKRLTPLRHLISKWVLIILNILLFISVMAFLILKDLNENMNIIAIIPLSFFIFWILWMMWGWRFDIKKHSVIYLKNRSSKKNFFSRKKDDIILAIISSIFGCLLTLLVIYLTGKFK